MDIAQIYQRALADTQLRASAGMGGAGGADMEALFAAPRRHPLTATTTRMAGLGGPGADVLKPGGRGRRPQAAACGGRSPQGANPPPMTRVARAACAKTCPGRAGRAACGGVGASTSHVLSVAKTVDHDIRP
eukprot:45254-Pleurochrysis_carterae.AAC.2